MEALMSIVVGVLFGTGVYMMLRGSTLKLVIGIALLSHGANLLLFTMGGLKKGAIPILGASGSGAHTDPLVQALILTAIVISFGVTAFLLVVVYRVHQEMGSDDLDVLRSLKG
ncbi:MAG: Na(+)/H(+) antiporter subunit C [Chloroflexi bacterium]|nr:Na(+)/H(+) antiporter subunit C [Chloroflexota bacterium]